MFIESWLLRVDFPSSLNLHTSISSDTGKIKPPFWKGPDSLKRKDIHLGVDLSFSEKLYLQQADVLYLLSVAFITLCDISSKHDMKEKMGSRSVVEKYRKIAFPCPRKIPWVFTFLTCGTNLPSMKILLIRRIGKALCWMLEYTVFCE